MIYRLWGKRLLDVVIALIALVAFGWFLLLLCVLIRLRLGTPVLFRQTRPGLAGRPFELIKFRTMTDARDATGALLPDAQRSTDFGRWLSATSLDELPELWNVLRGEMSLVGPRPLLMEYLPLYSPFQRRRHAVRPGLTGWAQINGRNRLAWDEKFALDIWYVDQRGLWLDLKILLLTLGQVLAQRDVDTHQGVGKFRGTLP